MELLDDAFVEKEMTYWNVPGMAVALCRDGEVLFEKGYGCRLLASKEPMTPFTLSGIASCSKSFTSAVLAALVDRGLLDYDTPVREYLPDFALMDPVATAQATVRDMLYHRTGLAGHDAMWPDDTVSRDEWMHRLRYLEPNRPFRSATQYSNVIYSLLGHIAERLTGRTWEELVRELIFEPLGMKRSCLTVEEMRRDSNYAVGYFERDRHGTLEEMPAWEMNVGAPAAAVNTCVHEMMSWLMLHLENGVYEGKRLFSENVMQQMHRGCVEMNLFPWSYPEIPSCGFYGMGWKSFFYRGMPLVFHTGELEGYCAMQILMPEQKLGIMIQVNRHKPLSPFLNEIAYTLIDHALGMPDVDWAKRLHEFDGHFGGTHYDWRVNLLPDAPVPGTCLSHEIAAYTGIFESKAYGKIQVKQEKDGLILYYKHWAFPMEHYHYDTFRIRELKEDTIFVTLPMTYHYEEISGTIDGCFLKLEPETSSIWFQKLDEEPVTF